MFEKLAPTSQFGINEVNSRSVKVFLSIADRTLNRGTNRLRRHGHSSWHVHSNKP